MNRQPGLKILLRLALLLSIGFSCFTSAMAAEDDREYQLKAGFISNFLRFISWPEHAFNDVDSVIVICVVGSNPFGSALDVVAKKKVGQRRINIVYIDSSTDIPPCHMLYISKSMVKKMDSIISAIGGRAIVTVSDVDSFASLGGSIEFIIKNERLSFIINNTDLKKRGISARASMLNLAASVY